MNSNYLFIAFILLTHTSILPIHIKLSPSDQRARAAKVAERKAAAKAALAARKMSVFDTVLDTQRQFPELPAKYDEEVIPLEETCEQKSRAEIAVSRFEVSQEKAAVLTPDDEELFQVTTHLSALQLPDVRIAKQPGSFTDYFHGKTVQAPVVKLHNKKNIIYSAALATYESFAALLRHDMKKCALEMQELFLDPHESSAEKNTLDACLAVKKGTNYIKGIIMRNVGQTSKPVQIKVPAIITFIHPQDPDFEKSYALLPTDVRDNIYYLVRDNNVCIVLNRYTLKINPETRKIIDAGISDAQAKREHAAEPIT